MADAVQSYKKHTRFLPGFHFFVIPVLLVNMLNEGRHLWMEPTRHNAWQVIFAAALLMVAFLSRIQALTVQDRVIRLEMRLRLRELLPPDLQPRIREFTRNQLVAMRFASDRELPAIARKVLDEHLEDRKAIKLLVQEWEADHLRA